MDPLNDQPIAPCPRALPDLPDFADDDVVIHDAPRRHPRRSAARQSSPPARRAAAISSGVVQRPRRDVVQRVQPGRSDGGAPPGTVVRKRSDAWFWSTPVLPAWRQVVEHVLPNALMALSALGVMTLGTIAPLGVPIWAIGLILPTIVLALLANPQVRPLWRRHSLVNLATIAVVFPALVVRQSVMRVPFVEGGNGTLLAPIASTTVVAVLLALLAGTCVILYQDDPEFAGIAFLPCAMMVPFLAGDSDITGLHSALRIVFVVYLAGSLLTVISSMLPGAYPVLVAPLAIGLEFIVLTVLRQGSIFPIGAGTTARLLFFAVVLLTVVFSILVSVGSAWVHQVSRMARSMRASRPT